MLHKEFKASSFIELLQWRAHNQSEQYGFTFLLDDKGEELSLTYKALDQQARVIGTSLQNLGAYGERVLLLYPPGLDYICAFLGCLYAGAVAVPAYPPNPARLNRTLPRLLTLVADAQATKALTMTPLLTMAQSMFSSFPDLAALDWVATDTLPDTLAESWQKPTIDENSIALLQYTSGSTSTPKGVMLTQGNLLHNSSAICRSFRHNRHSKGVIWLPPYHDMGLIGGILQPLYGGFPVMLMSPLDFLADPLRWLQAITRYQATTSGGPNFAYDLCVDKTTPEQREGLDLSSWKVAFNGAEPIRPDTLDRFTDTFAPYGFRREAFYPCYGLAEATLIVTGPAKLQEPVLETSGFAPASVAEETSFENRPVGALVGCGQTLSDQDVIIVDNTSFKLCDSGQVGEIWVQGPSVATGYWNNPELTAYTFDAFLEGGEGPFLRTGDLGFLKNGELFVTGRIKDLIIIRGRNYYPQDIEQTVAQSHPKLRLGCGAAFSVEVGGTDHLVVVQEIKPGSLAAGEDQSIMKAIRESVAQTHGLLLHDVVLLKARSILKTSSGKIQRYACRRDYLADELDVVACSKLTILDSTEVTFSLTRDSLLAADSRSWLTLLKGHVQEQAFHILGVPVDLNLPLIAAGFDSLTIVELKSRLEADLGLPIRFSIFFEGVSAAQLAAMLLEGLITTTTNLPNESISVIARESLLPLSFAQERFWILQQLQSEVGMHNISVSIQLKGRLDRNILQQAVDAVLHRHEVLRTTFVTEDGHPYQQVVEKMDLPLLYIDLSSRSDFEDNKLKTVMAEHGQTAFDLSKGPLLRATLLCLDAEHHTLLLTMHHIISDGWSIGLLVRDMAAYYRATINETAVSLPPLPVQYADYAYFRRQNMSGKRLEQCLAYWQEQLKHSPLSLNLPTDYSRPAKSTAAGKVETIHLPEPLVEALKTTSRHQHVTLFMTLLAVLKVVLFQWTGQEDMVIGTVIAGRDRREVQDLVGCFINFLPIRSQLSTQTVFAKLLQQLKDHLVEAYEYQDCPFEKLVRAVNPDRKHHPANPLFNVAFLLQNFPHFEDNIFQSPVLLEGEFSLLDMRFIAVEVSDGITFTCEYSTDIFKSDTVKQLLKAYYEVLEKLIARPQLQISDLALREQLQVQAQAARHREQASTIAISATFTAEPVKESLAFWMQELHRETEVVVAPYNQVFQQLLDPQSLLARNQGGINVVLVQLTEWQRFDEMIDVEREAKVRKNVNDLVHALKLSVARSHIPHLVFCLKAAADDLDAAALFNQMEALIVAELSEINGLHLITDQALARHYPVSKRYDLYTDQLGHIPFTDAFFTSIGTMIARKINAIQSEPYKVIVLDCDQTLWQGVCAEDGVRGIDITPYHVMLQKFMVAQHDAGRLICLCSKNDEADVIAVFQQRPDMILKEEHIVSHRINWHSKSENIKSLAQELQLGLNSFIFLDDNPVDCAEVKANCPQVLTLELPQQPQQIPLYLNHVWAFDHPQITAEDEQRTAYYKQNLKRQQHLKSTSSLADFLASLDLKIEILDIDPSQIPRISQLTQRTNQFNFSKIRYTEGEIHHLLTSAQFQGRAVTVSDRFGQYGLVGTMIFESGQNAIVVNTFLLSCRVLGRGVEHRMLAELAGVAIKSGCQYVEVHYTHTQRSRPALDFLNTLPVVHKTTAENVTIFRFSAKQLHTLTYQPTQTDQVNPETDALITRTAPEIDQRINSKSEQQNHIATSLHDAKQILNRIRTHRHKRTSTRDIILPRTPTEKILAQIWCDLLGLEQVSIYDDFFDVGGHSLLATQVLSRVRESFHIEIPFQELFTTNFTVEDIAKTIEWYQIEQADADDIHSLLKELDTLSDEDAKSLIQKSTA